MRRLSSLFNTLLFLALLLALILALLFGTTSWRDWLAALPAREGGAALRCEYPAAFVCMCAPAGCIAHARVARRSSFMPPHSAVPPARRRVRRRGVGRCSPSLIRSTSPISRTPLRFTAAWRPCACSMSLGASLPASSCCSLGAELQQALGSFPLASFLFRGSMIEYSRGPTAVHQSENEGRKGMNLRAIGKSVREHPPACRCLRTMDVKPAHARADRAAVGHPLQPHRAVRHAVHV